MVANNNSSQASSEPSALWSARHEQRQRQRQPRQQDPARGGGGGSTTTISAGESSRQNQGDSPPRDVASMKAEIAVLQSDTTATLDRAIAAAQATVNMGNHISTELLEQREQMGDIDAEARDIDDNLKRTGYNLKHGFTWRGALTSPFRKASKKPPGAAVRRRDIAPVFKDDYQQQQDSNKTKNKPAAAPAHGGATDSKGKKERTGLFGTSSPKRNAGNKKGSKAGDGGGAGAGGGNRMEPGLPEHVPEGFDKQLDDLDGLLDGLSAQANAIGAELRQQNEGIGALGERVEPLKVETASQAQQIKRRFRVRG